MGSLKKQSILPRMDGILQDLQRLKKLSFLPVEELEKRGDNFALAQFYLRQALEGVFHIGSHILSRLPGGRATEYKEIARLLGEKEVVPMEFAKSKLMPMAGYRTRLTHFYYEVGPKEILGILKGRLKDIEEFLHHIRELLKKPDRLGLSVE
jgi:uncharacterized protein YutE (UPF0331/DUF86 family)